MRYIKKSVLIMLLIPMAFSIYAQDLRTLETKVADLLALMPAKDPATTEKLMNDMLALGDAGLKLICNKIVPPGTGDDVQPRFAVESFSRFLSGKGKENEKAAWEKICISYVKSAKDNNVKYFFLKQLQTMGGIASAEAAKELLKDGSLCSPAIGVIVSAGGENAERILSEALKDTTFPCAAQAMNELAAMKSDLALPQFILWSQSKELPVRAAALKALAQSGSPEALKILQKAAKEVKYSWEYSGATSSYLAYADRIAEKGDIKGMTKICNTIISNCNQRTNIQFKAGALETIVKYKGKDAMPYLIEAARHTDKSYRNTAMRLASKLPGEEITSKWMEFFNKAPDYSKPEIIAMLAERKNIKALPLITSSLDNPIFEVRKEAVNAIVVFKGKEAIKDITSYMMKHTEENDQEIAKNALMTITGSKDLPLLLPVLKEGPPQAQKTIIEILAWSKQSDYFQTVLPYISSDVENLRTAAYKALPELVSPSDQEIIIELISQNSNPVYIADLQIALANAANKISDPEMRSDVILKSPLLNTNKEKLIPVLANTGGRKALEYVLGEFEKGSPELRDICFKALTSWNDYSAASALYEICASGNKTFEGPAFNAYVRIVRSAPVTDEQKLLLFRKIMPYATSAERKNRIITEIGKIRTYQALFFVAPYLDDPETSAAAAHAAMYIALPPADSKTGMYGSKVREILEKAITKLTGPEAEYNRELIRKYLDSMPPDEGFVPMFNGRDLTGWQGLVGNPITRAKMSPAELAKQQAEANKKMLENWSVKDGCIWFNGSGDNLCSIKEYGDFELLVDWRITKKGDSGIYLRGCPQVQIWDTSRVEVGAQVGSGGLYNNQKYPSKPLTVADNPVGEWNTFRIIMIGEKVSVWLNGILVVDDVVMENYWDRSIPIFPKGPIELQAHGTDLGFRDIYIREINEKFYNLTPEERTEGFVSLFNGKNLDGWIGDKVSYVVEDGNIVIKPREKGGGNLYTEKEYSDFIFRFEFQLTPAANNGLGIRTPLTGDAAYVGMEIQILDDSAPVYANLEPYQYHGSVYGVIPAKRGYLKPVGEWNYEEVYARGTSIKVTLNGTVIVDGDIAEAIEKGTMDKRDHPGLKNKSGHIGFLGHGSVVRFRNIRIKELN
ncbi:MAG TPA: DUF1080 domain-containing protein [Bacteroidales bacterium]|nr:hypothetical protein [Bacteroidales bacterium]HRC89294.1 DUF1080 domain-containing protein [Bacteroidales bacterium]